MRAKSSPDVLARLRAEWRRKLLLFVVINAAFWGGYQLLSRQSFFPLLQVPVTALDRAVPYQPEFWGWIYLSQFLLTGGLPLLLTTREGIRRYMTSLAVMSLVSFAVFLFLPTQAPRPLEPGAPLSMRFIAFADGPLNAMPSLHAAFLVCMAGLAWRMFGLRTLLVTGVWGTAILYSTLATKQHYVLDLVAGGALGSVADWLAWRGASAAAMIPVSNGVASQSGDR